MGYETSEIQELVRQHGSIRKAAEASGIDRRTIQRKLNGDNRTDSRPYEVAALPEGDIPIEDIISAKERQFEAVQARKKAEMWRETSIKIKGPVGILWFGDPHLDDNGCNIKLVKRDLAIARSSPAILAANLGDTLNNWVGGLQKLYAHQDMGESRAMRMARWFTESAPWWLWIYGNHCLWPTANTNLMKHFASEASGITQDWQARVQLNFPNGRKSKIHAAHNFPGHSQYNKLHGPMKKAGKSPADLLICGDKHCWALQQDEDAESGHVQWFARARGYKFIDSYGEQLGYDSQQYGAAIMSVYDPGNSGPGFLQCFADATEGAEFLKWKRDRWEAGR